MSKAIILSMLIVSIKSQCTTEQRASFQVPQEVSSVLALAGSCNELFGTTPNLVFCPDGEYIVGARLQYEPETTIDNTGANDFTIICAPLGWSSTVEDTTICPKQGSTSLPWTLHMKIKYCPVGEFVTGFTASAHAGNGGACTGTGIENVNLQCSSGFIGPYSGPFGTGPYAQSQSCPPFQYASAAQVVIEPYRNVLKDDAGLTRIILGCTDYRTRIPTKIPTVSPSASPTKVPTDLPSVSPSKVPTETPSVSPTKQSSQPTSNPTFTTNPTKVPSSNSNPPSMTPSSTPTKIPTLTPSSLPTKSSGTPTDLPIAVTQDPTMITVAPTSIPTSFGQGIRGPATASKDNLLLILCLILAVIIVFLLLGIFLYYRNTKNDKKDHGPEHVEMNQVRSNSNVPSVHANVLTVPAHTTQYDGEGALHTPTQGQTQGHVTIQAQTRGDVTVEAQTQRNVPGHGQTPVYNGKLPEFKQAGTPGMGRDKALDMIMQNPSDDWDEDELDNFHDELKNQSVPNVNNGNPFDNSTPFATAVSYPDNNNNNQTYLYKAQEPNKYEV